MRKTAAKVLEAVTTKTTRRKRASNAAPAPVGETRGASEMPAAITEMPTAITVTPTAITVTPTAITVTPTAITVTRPTHDMIAARAYALFVARGGAHGYAHEDWARAERELGAR